MVGETKRYGTRTFGCPVGRRTIELLVAAILAIVAAVSAQQKNDSQEDRDYADGPLTAEDFRTPPPQPEKLSGRKAHFMGDMRYDLQYRLKRSGRRWTATVSSIHIRAVALPGHSWNLQPQDSRLLDHEQGHFDLIYIAVLRARLHFAASPRLTGSGSSDELAIKALREKVASHLTPFADEMRAAHIEYDEITQHGTIAQPQEEQRQSQKRLIETLTEQLKTDRPP